jgi:hypothetical protein
VWHHLNLSICIFLVVLVASIRPRTNEEDDVGVVQLRQECHLGPELEHAPLVELLLDELLHGHLHALPPALVHHAVAPQAHLTHFDKFDGSTERQTVSQPGVPSFTRTGLEALYLIADLDLLEVDDPPAEVGRCEELVFLEQHALAHHLLQGLAIERGLES